MGNSNRGRRCACRRGSAETAYKSVIKEVSLLVNTAVLSFDLCGRRKEAGSAVTARKVPD